MSLNVNPLSCWKITYPLHQPNLKTYFSDATVLFNFIIHRFEVFRRTIISQNSYWSDCVLENMELDVMKTIKSIHFQVVLS